MATLPHLKSNHSSLFVGDLSIFCSEIDLLKTFETFGEVLDVKVMRCDETHKNLCYGFVKYADHHVASKAMEDLNGKLLCGRPMRLVNKLYFLDRLIN
jgi:RNA recognition motif-containing protein